MNSASPPEILTVLVAARNEAQSLPALHPRIAAVLKRLDGVQGRVLYVDDGSTDGTWEVMQGPVSYTHLDVYKRQVPRSGRWRTDGVAHRIRSALRPGRRSVRPGLLHRPATAA